MKLCLALYLQGTKNFVAGVNEAFSIASHFLLQRVKWWVPKVFTALIGRRHTCERSVLHRNLIFCCASLTVWYNRSVAEFLELLLGLANVLLAYQSGCVWLGKPPCCIGICCSSHSLLVVLCKLAVAAKNCIVKCSEEMSFISYLDDRPPMNVSLRLDNLW